MPKLLIIDDMATDRMVLRSFLASRSYEIVEASDGEMGIAMAQSEMPNLVLLDIVMPKLDGFQVCRRIKRDPQTGHIPVILISSKGQDSDKFWGMKQGASDYLTKPCTQEGLLAAIDKVLPS
ncbi:MAG: response regulator [Verrucomicrobia bacterium]|nr:response regulator [Verrucomicrobiota bacterium]